MTDSEAALEESVALSVVSLALISTINPSA